MDEKQAFVQEHRDQFQKLGQEVREKIAFDFKGLGKQLRGAAPTILPVAGALGLAGLGYHALKQDDQAPHQKSFQQALELFPELQQEDPKKVHMLWSSAVQVAPTMATNPLLLGTWIKGLARGYEGVHLSTEDLKRLQDLEIGVRGKPADRQSFLGTLGQATRSGADIANIMGAMSKGRRG